MPEELLLNSKRARNDPFRRFPDTFQSGLRKMLGQLERKMENAAPIIGLQLLGAFNSLIGRK